MKYKKLYKLSPEQFVEYALCNLAHASRKIRSFYKDYHTYLSTQRNLLIDEIKKSLKDVGKKRKKGVFYRVVSSRYMNDPLCMAGSLLYSGRFNFEPLFLHCWIINRLSCFCYLLHYFFMDKVYGYRMY